MMIKVIRDQYMYVHFGKKKGGMNGQRQCHHHTYS